MHFLITAGGTREYIDPIRFISNASSGKTGYALTMAAIKAGHKVTLITAPTNLQPPVGAKIIHVEAAQQMFSAVKRNFASCDCLIMAAAVSDYKPERRSKTKMKKSDKPVILKLKSNPDILKWAGEHKKKSQAVVGFALEDENLRANAEEKMKNKKLDVIVANSLKTIGSDKATIHLKIRKEKWLRLQDTSKETIAKYIIKLTEGLK